MFDFVDFQGRKILFVNSMKNLDMEDLARRKADAALYFIEDVAEPGVSTVPLWKRSTARRGGEGGFEGPGQNVLHLDFNNQSINSLGLDKDSFDYVVFKNSLETLYDPWTWLSDIRPYVKPDGRVLVEIANIRNMNVFSSIVNGYFTYSDEGIVTFDKLRFFTSAELLIHAVNAGYGIVDVRRFADASPGDQLQVAPGEVYKFQGNNFVLNGIPGESLIEMFSDRALIILKKQDAGNGFISPLCLPKPPDYFENPRKDLIEMMDRTPGAVLEIGCGIGTTCALVKDRYPACKTIGIDIDERSIQKAATIIDRAIAADIEKAELSELGIGEESLDYILYGDVLEHLRNPWEILRKHKKYLKLSGQILSSIPNIRHNSVLVSLLYGRWTYTSSGILDATHLRFFTLREIKRLFRSAGLYIYEIKGNPDLKPEDLRLPPGYAQFSFSIRDMTLQNVPREEVPEFSIIQFLVKAGKEGETDGDS